MDARVTLLRGGPGHDGPREVVAPRQAKRRAVFLTLSLFDRLQELLDRALETAAFVHEDLCRRQHPR